MNIRKFLFNSAIRADQLLAASVILKRSPREAKNIFFPGCSLMGYNPGYVFAAKRYLEASGYDCGIVSGCCAKPLKLIGSHKTFQRRIDDLRRHFDAMNADTVITACQSCYHILKQYDTDRNILSLWPLMAKLGLSETLRDKFLGLEASIQDSCTSTPEIFSSVREILKYLGVSVREFPGSRLKCCGGLQTLTSGDRRLGHECMIKRAAEAPCSTIISYCASCRSAMSLDGQHKSIHILDLIFGDGETSKPGSNLLNRLITAKMLKEM